jgi:hypothetical protein
VVTITIYGAAGEIGGNKILLEDRDTRVLLDFGASFRARGLYYEEFLTPRVPWASSTRSSWGCCRPRFFDMRNRG